MSNHKRNLLEFKFLIYKIAILHRFARVYLLSIKGKYVSGGSYMSFVSFFVPLPSKIIQAHNMHQRFFGKSNNLIRKYCFILSCAL